MQIGASSDDLDRALARLTQLLSHAVDAMVGVRDRLAACWPTRPSMRALATRERALFESGMKLVVRDPWTAGELYLAIEAANSTLDTHGHAAQLPSPSERWSLGRVDPTAEPTPTPGATHALRAAIETAEVARDTLHRQLDEITRIAPAETWLPAWTIDEARGYIAAARWRHARPNQPPHEYTIRNWQPDMTRDFLAFTQLIQSQGVLKTWGEYVHAYLEVDGLEYWTMGARVPETSVINRAPVGGPSSARPLPPALDVEVHRAVQRALAYRRMDPASEVVPTGILGERLCALYRSAMTTDPPPGHAPGAGHAAASPDLAPPPAARKPHKGATTR
jgi:hypothetical protein